MTMARRGTVASRKMARIAFVFSEARKVSETLEGLIVIGGAVCGIAGSIPPAVLLEGVLKRGMRVKVAHGLASILVSFAFMSAVLVAIRMVARSEILTFGVAMMASFILFWGVEALRAWAVRDGRGSEGRN